MILVLGKALNILELLGKNTDREMSLGEIAGTLKMDRGTCTNIIKTLAERGYVQQSGPRRGYKLGYMVYDLANSAVLNDDLTKIAREDITSLSKDLNESAILSVIRNDKRIVLFQTEPLRDVYVRTNIDKCVYSTNSGRVIIANYSPEHQEKFIIRVGLPSEKDWPEVFNSDNPQGTLMNYLSTIRQNGYYMIHDMKGIFSVGAPLFRNGHVAGSIGVYLPSFRVDGNEGIILQKVLAAAERINTKIRLTDEL